MENIEHVVVLMMENRSFDSILGGLYPDRKDFNGLTGKEFNVYNGKKYYVWNDPILNSYPTDDPGESFKDMNQQIFDLDSPSNVVPPGAEESMGGFAKNYKFTHPDKPANEVMQYYNPEQVPVSSFLAKQYAVCDAWHASSPSQTWGNRFFLHTATANGHPNNLPPHFPYEMKSIFRRFPKSKDQKNWRVYFKDHPLTAMLSDLWGHLDHFHLFKTFEKDAAEGNLPAYSFIEPSYYSSETEFESSHHPTIFDNPIPGIDIRSGERYIAQVYNAVRSSPLWKKTLLVVIYDENGGIYDHVTPPINAPMPEPPREGQIFNFDRYGVRVPAILISPYIEKGTIFRAPKGSQPIDHTSVIKTLREKFDLGPHLTGRDKEAPGLWPVLNLSNPTNNGELVDVSEELPYDKVFLEQELSDLQKGIHHALAHFPDLSTIELEAHMKLLKEGKKMEVVIPKKVKHSIKTIKDKLKNVFKHIDFDAS